MKESPETTTDRWTCPALVISTTAPWAETFALSSRLTPIQFRSRASGKVF